MLESSLKFRDFLDFGLLAKPIRAITPGVAHSPPMIETLLSFLSFNIAVVLARLSRVHARQADGHERNLLPRFTDRCAAQPLLLRSQ